MTCRVSKSHGLTVVRPCAIFLTLRKILGIVCANLKFMHFNFFYSFFLDARTRLCVDAWTHQPPHLFNFFFLINHANSPKLYRFYNPYRSRDLMSPVCGIFSRFFALFLAQNFKPKVLTAQENQLLECLVTCQYLITDRV